MTIYKTVEVEVEINDDDYECECEDDATERETDYRLSLYRAIYAGDIFKAREIADMMAMIDIDRDQIEVARRG